MSAVYTRRVSFDSLNPNIQVEPDDPIHIPPQYINRINSCASNNNHDSNTKVQTNKRGLDLNFGYDPSYSKHQDLYKVFDSFQEINNKGSYKSTYQTTRRKCPKLPPPPEKSILKKQSYDFNDANDSIPKGFNENDQLNTFTSVLPPQQRKKSIVEMTNEELIAMDQQFRTGVNLDEFKFDGDNYLPFHNLSSIDSKKPKSSMGNLSNIDKLVGRTANNKKILKSAGSINFNSYSSSFRHKDLTKFIMESCKKQPDDEAIDTDDNDEDKEDEQEYPESLRNLLVYISGRRHTWDSINWVLKNFLVDGDNLVIICQLPSNPNESIAPDSQEEFDCEFIKTKCDSLSSYIFKAIEILKKQNLKISITIEFIKDKSVKNLIKNSIELYNPQFFLISSLISNRLTVKFENNHVKLPFYLIKCLGLATIMIPDLLIDKSSVSLDQDNQKESSPTIPEITLEPTNDNEDFGNDEQAFYFKKLISVTDAYKTVEHDHVLNSNFSNSFSNNITRTTSSNSNLTDTNSNSRTESLTLKHAESPSSYYPKIKFSDNLSIPKYNTNGSSISNSPFSSRRNSNNSSGIYKVKSLLADEPSSNQIQRSKSYSLTPVTNSSTNNSTERKLNTNTVKKSKSIDEGTTSKKSGFFAKLGFKKH